MNFAEAAGALDGLRTSLKSDGADLAVKSVSNDSIELSLIFRDTTCKECIVGSDLLAAKVRIALGKVFPQVPKIVIHDPRNPG